MANKAAANSGRVSFTVETTGQTYRFDTFKEFLEWVNEELNRWGALSEQSIRTTFSNLSASAVDTIQKTYANLQNHLNQIASAEPAIDSGAQWPEEEIISQLNGLVPHLQPIVSGQIPTSDSTAGESILSLTRTAPQRAAALAILSIDHPNVNNQGLPNFAAMRAILDELQDPHEKEKREALENQLKKMRQRWDGKLNALVKDLEERRSLEDKARKKFEGDLNKGRSLVRTLFTTSNQERHRHSEEMERIEQTFQTQLALEAPATYWSSKRTLHTVGASIAGLIFFALSAAAIWLAWSLGPDFVSKVTGDKQGFNMGAFAMITIPALAAAWAMRFVARIFVSNLHLGQDASLRSTMITTYLALMKDPDSEVSREERALILNAMFRPAEHHGDDDGPSPKLIDLMQKMGQR